MTCGMWVGGSAGGEVRKVERRDVKRRAQPPVRLPRRQQPYRPVAGRAPRALAGRPQGVKVRQVDAETVEAEAGGVAIEAELYGDRGDGRPCRDDVRGPPPVAKRRDRAAQLRHEALRQETLVDALADDAIGGLARPSRAKDLDAGDDGERKAVPPRAITRHLRERLAWLDDRNVRAPRRGVQRWEERTDAENGKAAGSCSNGGVDGTGVRFAAALVGKQPIERDHQLRHGVRRLVDRSAAVVLPPILIALQCLLCVGTQGDAVARLIA